MFDFVKTFITVLVFAVVYALMLITFKLIF